MFQPQLLIPPIVAILGLAFLLGAAMRRFHGTKLEQIALGLLFGGTVSLGMFNPLTLGDGLIFDTRTVLLAVAVVYAGHLAGAITLVFGLVSRVVIGGAGMWSGLVGLCLAFAIAIGWVRFFKHRFKNPFVHDLLLGLTINAAIVALFVLPLDVATALLTAVLPKMLIVNVFGAIAIGYVFRREYSFYSESRLMKTHARRDHLTNLLNRRGLDSAVDALGVDARGGHALFYFDIDNFKHINDTFGHDTGDAALAIVAARITDTIREGAIFARHGGDEFSIYLHGIESEDVKGVAERVCKAISDQNFVHGDVIFPVTVSLGGYWTKRDVPLQTLIERADAQLLLAKRAGKNRHQIAYHRDMEAAHVA